MKSVIKIVEDVYWVGINDRHTHLFENLWPLENGVTYNSYLIDSDKVALIDTVKSTESVNFLQNIQNKLGDKKIDYLIINHMEPDHTGAIKELLNVYPDIEIIGNNKTYTMLTNYYGIEDNFITVKQGDTIDLGGYTLEFHITPMLHWPETMMTYLKEKGVLFSGDAFGGFGALDGGIFDDEVNIEFYENEIMRYFTNIVGKYSRMVLNAINKLSDLEINVIAATHGPIWRSNPEKIINDYKKWSEYEAKEGAVIIYGSMYGNTERMADYIARCLSEFGIKDIRIYDSSKTHLSYLINEIWKYKYVFLGSCAYNTRVFPAMEGLLNTMKNKGLKGKKVGIFGSYTWSGGGVSNLKKFVDEVGWELIGDPIEFKGAPDQEHFKKAEELSCIIGDCYTCEV